MAYGVGINTNLPDVLGPEPEAAAALRAWANEVQTTLEAKVTPAGFVMNADLSFATLYNATNVQAVGLAAAEQLKTGAGNAGKLYRFNGELYFTNASGTTLKITNAGTLNIAAVAGIGGDYSSDGNAIVDYTTATSLYRLLSNLSNLARANVEVGALRVYGTGNNPSYYANLAVPVLAASYTMTLPSALPASTSLLQWTAAGLMQSTRDPGVDTLTVASTSSFAGKATFAVEPAHPSRSVHISHTGAVLESGDVTNVVVDWDCVIATTIDNSDIFILPLPVEEGWVVTAVDFHIRTNAGAFTRVMDLGYFNQTVGVYTFPGGSYSTSYTATNTLATRTVSATFTTGSVTGSGTMVGKLVARYQMGAQDKWYGCTVHYSRT